MASGLRSITRLLRRLEDQQAELVEAGKRLSVGVEMTTVCSELPDDVWERVLAYLPERALCRFCTVRKSWRSLVTASSFRGLRGRLRKRAATVLVSRDHKDVVVYDSDESKWFVVDVLFLRAAFAAVGVRNYKIVAAAEGLLAVWSSLGDAGKAVVICNPVAKTWRFLPRMGIHMAIPWFVYMVVDSETSAVRIFAHGVGWYSGGTQVLFQIYDSGVNSWKLCRLPPRTSRVYNRPLSGLLYNGSYHALFSRDAAGHDYVLMAYDEPKDVWVEVRVDGFPTFINSITGELVVAKSRLYLVTPCLERGWQLESPCALSVDISEIRSSVGECARVKLPSSAFDVLFRGSRRVAQGSYVTVVFDQSICFVSYLGSAVYNDEVANQWQPMIQCGIKSELVQLFGSSFVIDAFMSVKLASASHSKI